MCGCPCHTSWSEICFIDGGCCSGARIVAPPQAVASPLKAGKVVGVPGSLGSRCGHCPGCDASVPVGQMLHVAMTSQVQRFIDRTGVSPGVGPLWVCEDCYELSEF